MAAVTVTNPSRAVTGSVVTRFYTISGASGSTLPTGMSNILFVDIQQSTAAGTISLITAFSIAGNPSTITFTSSAPMVTEIIAVTGREG
jgi:hypothetical protein